MTRRWIVPVVLLAAIGVVGCTSNSPTASPASTTSAATSTASSTSAASAATSAAAGSTISAAPSQPSGAGASGAVSGSAAPVTLDATTVAWYTAVCAGQKELQSLSSPDTVGEVAKDQQTVVTAYGKLSASAQRTVAALTPLPPPSVPAGEASKALRIKYFQAIASGYGAGASTVKAATPNTEAELKKLVDATEATVGASVKKVVAAATPLPAAYAAAVEALPACAGIQG